VQRTTAAKGSEAGGGAATVLVFQTVATAKGSKAGGGGTVCEDVEKAQELGSWQREEGVVIVEPVAEAEDDEASGAIRDSPSAECASGCEMKSGGRSSEVGASGGPMEPALASTTTAEQVLVGTSFEVAIQTAVAAESSEAGGGGTVGADAS
jgi:hypothetical protein